MAETTKSIDVVTQKDMATQQQPFMPETLDTVPGVMFQPQGGPGQYSTINIRGAGTEHVQFQYNGIRERFGRYPEHSAVLHGGHVRRPRHQPHRGIERTNSDLYGSAAMGGVVNVISQKWQQGFLAEVRSEMGEHNTFIENANLAYGTDKYYFNFNPMYINTDGITNGGPNGFWYHNMGFTGGGGIKFGDNTTLEINNITYSNDAALGSSPSLNARHQLITNQAYADEHREGLLTMTGLTFSQQVSSCWDYTVKGAYGSTERHYFLSDIPGNQSNYDGTTTYIEMQHNVRVTDGLTPDSGFRLRRGDVRRPRIEGRQETTVPELQRRLVWVRSLRTGATGLFR